MPHQSSTEQRLGLRRIYVNGIPRTSYKELESRLFSLHFMLTKIVNISYIAQNCVEFVIQEDYTTTFLVLLNVIQLTWKAKAVIRDIIKEVESYGGNNDGEHADVDVMTARLRTPSPATPNKRRLCIPSCVASPLKKQKSQA
ncbi:hypothetical protein K450DRAFT_263598 [Umbelopsis ramanniana AG]|uniref:Uncharacterized protein n=1 Tax=Umbelopsis ramanniana AG TaxID=1314678 RepID=A0AAD5E1F9_UMBRA|nr:uncharacterized protein K450DRAFT_263598 [Umbelopsis ramanniana AG]KAI8575049.1 hypothetical protein K450DRAFT_263598 [Umbelopsis ramanniana AG]